MKFKVGDEVINVTGNIKGTVYDTYYCEVPNCVFGRELISLNKNALFDIYHSSAFELVKKESKTMTEAQLRSILFEVFTTGNISYIQMSGFLIGKTIERAIEVAKEKGLIPTLLEEDKEENEHVCDDPELHAEGGHDV